MKFKIFTCLVVLSQFFLTNQAQSSYDMSFDYHCPALPIARFNEVPYQVVETNFRVGVVAFHKNGISRVKFTATDGVHTVNSTVYQFALNSRTNTKEYSMVLNPSTFDDKLVTITAVVYANSGETRTLDFVLYANYRKTIKEDTVYVSKSGSDNNDGVSGRPVKSIGKAFEVVKVRKKFPATILVLTEGTYDMVDVNGITNDFYVTVKSKSGLNPSKVIIQKTSRTLMRMGASLVKWEGVTFDFGKFSVYYSYGNKAVWFNNVKWINSYGWNDPCYADTTCTVSPPIRGNAYATNSSSREMLYAFVHFQLVRNCEVKRCVGDVFQKSLMVVNCNVDTIDGTALDHHSDLYQMFNQMDNVIVYGLTAKNLISTQALFLEPTYQEKQGDPRYKFSNSAFVDIDVQHVYTDTLEENNGGPPFSQMLSWFEHIIFDNVKLPHQQMKFRTEIDHNQWFSASNVVFKKCQLHPITYRKAIEGSPVKGVEFIDPYTTYPDCHDNIKNGQETGIDCGTCCLVDNDGDEYFVGYCNTGNGITDCDDNNPAIHPGATEILDGIDNNCDGIFHPNHSKDYDNDGVINGEDNCLYAPNPDQADYDMDRKGDVCDQYFTYTENAEERENGKDDLGTLKYRSGLSWRKVRGDAQILWDNTSQDKNLWVPEDGQSTGNHILVTTQGANWKDLVLELDIKTGYSGPNRGFVLLYKNNFNFYFFHLKDGAMKKRINGNDIILGSDAGLMKDHYEDDFMHFKARVVFGSNGVDFYISKNGGAEIKFNDPSPHVMAGSIGFIAEQDAGNKLFGVSADNITVEVPVTTFPVAYDADVVVCENTQVTLNAPSGYSQYNWSTGATTQSIVVASPGAYSVSAEDSTTCGGSDTATVAFYNTVSLGRDKLFCPGDTFVLDAGPGFTSYLWSTGKTTQRITVYSPGIYSVNVMNGNGCASSDNIEVKKTIKCLAIGDMEAKVSPSINDGIFELEVTDKTGNTEYNSANRNTADIQIISTDGRVVFSKVVEAIDQNGFRLNVNLTSVTTGLYFVLVRTNEEILTEKVFINSRIN